MVGKIFQIYCVQITRIYVCVLKKLIIDIFTQVLIITPQAERNYSSPQAVEGGRALMCMMEQKVNGSNCRVHCTVWNDSLPIPTKHWAYSSIKMFIFFTVLMNLFFPATASIQRSIFLESFSASTIVHTCVLSIILFPGIWLVAYKSTAAKTTQMAATIVLYQVYYLKR